MTQLRSARSPSPYPRMSYEEYLHDPSIGEHTEWVDGEVVEMMSVSNVHAEVTRYLISLLDFYTGARRLGRIYAEPFQMKPSPDLPGRAPDVFFIQNDHLDRVKRLNLDGPADLVIEVISTGSEEIDRGDKFYEYQQAGVPEYWLIDPDREVAEFYLLDDKGVFRSANVARDGVFESRAIDGLHIRVEWLWERPPVSDLLEDLGLR